MIDTPGFVDVLSGGAVWSAAFASAPRSALEIYDEVMVPRIFQPWGRLLVDELGVRGGEAVVDVACGPGSVTRVAAARVGSGGRVLGCDISAAMLAIARAKTPSAQSAAIDYVQAPAERLPAADGHFDVALCQQGLQFFPDRLAALAEIRRVLRPGGRAGVAVWAEIEQCPPFATLESAIRQVAGRYIADRYRGGPWGLASRDGLHQLLEQAGFEGIRVIDRTLPVIFESGPEQLARTLAASGVAGELSAFSAPDAERLKREVSEHARGLMVGEELRSHMTSYLAMAYR